MTVPFDQPVSCTLAVSINLTPSCLSFCSSANRALYPTHYRALSKTRLVSRIGQSGISQPSLRELTALPRANVYLAVEGSSMLANVKVVD